MGTGGQRHQINLQADAQFRERLNISFELRASFEDRRPGSRSAKFVEVVSFNF